MKLVKMTSNNSRGQEINHMFNLDSCLSVQTSMEDSCNSLVFYGTDGKNVTVPAENFDVMNSMFEDIWEFMNDDGQSVLEFH